MRFFYYLLFLYRASLFFTETKFETSPCRSLLQQAQLHFASSCKSVLQHENNKTESTSHTASIYKLVLTKKKFMENVSISY